MFRERLKNLFLSLVLLASACQPESKSSIRDPETARLQREVDSLRQVKEDLQEELNTVTWTDESAADVNPAPSPAAKDDLPLSKLSIIFAKKQFDANFNPVLRVSFRNDTGKSIASATIGVDFSFDSKELAENCHFDQKITLPLAPNASQTLSIPIPAKYNKNCADKVWVVVKGVLFSDGSKG